MPVSTGSLGEPRAKRCKHCDESGHRSDSGPGYWQLQLDRDLVETISSIYPEWFKVKMAEGGGGGVEPPAPNIPPLRRESPPKAVVDTSPLLNSMEQNKESLKVKLMLRRPVEQLVAQGIMPPLKTTPAFHGQRRQLERAKTGDLLKSKIQQRPSRLELESRHILEADPHVDPSLAEKQRMLKKARLADQLNDLVSHRPGPLELIQKNILHTEAPIENAVKAGRIPYKATCEGQLNRPQHPHSYVNPEDDSQSSEDNNVSTTSPGPGDVLETAAKSAGIVVSLIPATEGAVVVSAQGLIKDNNELFADLCRSVAAPLLQTASSPASLVSSTSTLSPLSSIASPVPSIISQPTTPAPPPMPVALTPRPIQSPVRSDAPGKDKNRKKSKSKATPKTRTIKFHEYKGPPSAQKSISPLGINAAGESSYELMLQQQTLLLQFQLQLQHKYPQIILPASQKTENQTPSSSSSSSTSSSSNNPTPSPAPSTTSESSTSTTRLVGRLEDMKVSDLKAELKRRNLPVSGSKPQLIERLKPFTGSIPITNITESSNSVDDSLQNSPQHDLGSPQAIAKEEPIEQMDVADPLSPNPVVEIIQPINTKTQDDIVREQRKRIEELQRELTLSQIKLQAATRSDSNAQYLANQKRLQARQQQQQQMFLQMQQLQALQAQQNEEQQKLQQQQHVAFQNQKNLTGSLVLNGTDAAIVINHLVGRNKLINGHTRANSLPNFINSIVTPVIAAPTPEVKVEDIKPPPVYEEATKYIKKEKSNVKSQIVDDVLEILIKNGELPASAAQDPSTPVSAESKLTEPTFPQMPTNDTALELDTNDILETLDTIENMDFTQLIELSQQGNNNIADQDNNVPMDTDDWLDSLLPSDHHSDLGGVGLNNNCSSDHEMGGYDPLMAIGQNPFDPFCLEDFRTPSDLTASLSWDKVDFAA